MRSQIVKIRTPKGSHAYQIRIDSGLLKGCGVWAKECLPPATGKMCIVSNRKVFDLYGRAAEKGLRAAGYKISVWLMQDGEKYKNLRSLQKLLSFLSEQGFTRTDAIVALGGGVVGDLAGFAASVYLRGIAVLQIPTTLLSQIDSSVGGKTAVNTEHGKNLVGTFYQPHGVLIDIETLRTLPPRELTAGFCEAIKQGAISGSALFNKTRLLLESYQVGRFPEHFAGKEKDEFGRELADLIAAQVAFKAKIVAGDQKEDVLRKDSRSRKILNFGHTIGHALEKATNYQQLKHGEAVGYGLLAAAEISENIGILDKNSLKSLVDVIALAGKLPRLRNITVEEVYRATVFDKKKAGNVTTWILLKKIGEPILARSDRISVSTIKRSIQNILK